MFLLNTIEDALKPVKDDIIKELKPIKDEIINEVKAVQGKMNESKTMNDVEKESYAEKVKKKMQTRIRS